MASRSKNSSSKGSTALILLFCIVVVITVIGVLYAPSGGTPISLEKKDANPVTLVFVGDIMFDRAVRSSVVKNLGGDYNRLYEHTSYLKEADVAFGNLEGPVATGGRNVGSRFSFRMDPVGLDAMQGAGIDVVSFANNHVGDYTLAAFTETIDRLKEKSILAAGAGKNTSEASSVQIINVRGVKIGFLAATDVGPNWMEVNGDVPGIILASDPNLAMYIAAAKQQVDILVMSFHWGSEYSPANARQEVLAKAAIDAGADIIVGHHPHVMQKIAYYNEKPIFYSLGNFIFDQYFSLHTMRGMVAFVSIDPETKKLTTHAMVSPLNTFYVPQPLIPFDESMLVTKPFTP